MWGLEINEINQGGEVPLLEAHNRMNEFILLLDSEEIKGAKQNRVLNTSILLSRKKRTIIPVSCTESGRWAYVSADFQPSGNMMPKAARTHKMKSVTTTIVTVTAECATVCRSHRNRSQQECLPSPGGGTDAEETQQHLTREPGCRLEKTPPARPSHHRGDAGPQHGIFSARRVAGWRQSCHVLFPACEATGARC